jgi:hypothetical protein
VSDGQRFLHKGVGELSWLPEPVRLRSTVLWAVLEHMLKVLDRSGDIKRSGHQTIVVLVECGSSQISTTFQRSNLLLRSFKGTVGTYRGWCA